MKKFITINLIYCLYIISRWGVLMQKWTSKHKLSLDHVKSHNPSLAKRGVRVKPTDDKYEHINHLYLAQKGKGERCCSFHAQSHRQTFSLLGEFTLKMQHWRIAFNALSFPMQCTLLAEWIRQGYHFHMIYKSMKEWCQTNERSYIIISIMKILHFEGPCPLI